MKTVRKAATKKYPWTKRKLFLTCAGSAVAVLVAATAIGFYFANKYWPYRYREVKPLLESVLASKISVGQYHRTYFPHPGFVANGLTLRRDSAGNLPPVGTAQSLIVQGSWIDLLLMRHRVALVEVVGLHIVIPPVGSDANHQDFPPGSAADFAGPTTAVEKLHFRDAILDIQRKNGGVYSYPIHDLLIEHLQRGHAISYALDMQNASPNGRIQSHGSFGPLPPDNLGATPLSGEFLFAPVHLSDIGTLHGELSSHGSFRGTLVAISAQADADVPNFAVGDGKQTDVGGSMHCTVNGLNGDVVLNTVSVKIGRTLVQVQGSVIGSPKITSLDLAISKGRVQDVLGPFLSERPPLTGDVWLHGHAVVVPAKGRETFLDRLRVNGSLDVPSEKLSDPTTESTLSAFSARAQKQDTDDAASSDVLSSLGGTVEIRNGILTSPRLLFQVPGAQAQITGNLNLKNDQVQMSGQLSMQADVSHVTTGWKSALLKPLAPFFKKKPAGAVIPIAITGKPGSYKVSQNLLHDK